MYLFFFFLKYLLASNDALTDLDLSWNHIRGKGAHALALSLKVNNIIAGLLTKKSVNDRFQQKKPVKAALLYHCIVYL